MSAYFSNLWLSKQWKKFHRAESGIAAVEFALIAPFMIILFFASVEVSNILIVDRKLTTVTSAVSDLVAQDMEITNAEMADILAVATALFEPFPAAGLSLTVTSVIDNGGTPQVDWTEDFQGGTSVGPGATSLPTGILTTGASVIVVEATYVHTTGVGYFLAESVTLTDIFYARPRRTPRVERTG